MQHLGPSTASLLPDPETTLQQNEGQDINEHSHNDEVHSMEAESDCVHDENELCPHDPDLRNTTERLGAITPQQRSPSTKDDFLWNELNPPLVAATLIHSQQEEERNPIQSIHNDNVVTVVTVEPNLVPYINHERLERGLHETIPHNAQNSQLIEMTPENVALVVMDTESTLPTQNTDEEKKKRQRGFVKLLCLGTFCCFLGATIVLAIGYSEKKKPRNLFDGASYPSVTPNMTFTPTFPISKSFEPTFAPTTNGGSYPPVAPTTTTTHTITSLPSSAPSCPETFRLASKKTFTDTTINSLYNIAFASNAYWEHSQSGKILGVFLYNDYFNMKLTIHSFILSESGVEADMVQQIDGSWDVMSLTVSDDGTVLVLGIASAFSLIDEEGGAIVVFQRLTPSTDLQWNQTHIEPTGGGQYGTVFDVTVNGNGTIIAASAGSQQDVSQSFVGVYRNTKTGLKIMGDRLVHASLDIGAKLELSGDGNRLFMATGDSRIQIFEYSVSDSDNGNGNYSGWNVSGQVFFEGSPNMHVSHDGDILVVASDSWDPIKVHAIVDARWETVDSFKGAVEGLSYSYQSTLSNDGTNIFVMALINNDDEGVLQAVGEWFRHGPDGYKSVSSLPLSADSIVRIAFNEDASQLVVASLFELLGLERICNTGQAVTPSPSAVASTVSSSPTVCFTDYKENWYVNTTRTAATGGSDIVVDDAASVIISQDGSTMVVIHAMYKNSTVLHVETFNLSLSSLSSSQYGPMTESKILLGQTSKVNASAISGDGYTMLLGVSSYAQSDGDVGGAFLVYHRSNASWYMHDSAIETGGGTSGSVFDVTCSHNGSVVAFYAVGTDGGVYVDVYAVNETGLLRKIDQNVQENFAGFRPSSPNFTTTAKVPSTLLPEVIVSGSGSRLFISSDMTVRSLDFDFGCDCWIVAGQSIENVSNGKIHVSFDGNLVAIGVAHFPIDIFVFHQDFWELLNSTSTLDNTGNINEALALIALSSDGTSVFTLETYNSQSARDEGMLEDQRGNKVIFIPVLDDVNYNMTATSIVTLVQGESGARTSATSAAHPYAVGLLHHAERNGIWYTLGSNLTLSTVSLVDAVLADNGNLLVVTNEGVNVYRLTC